MITSQEIRNKAEALNLSQRDLIRLTQLEKSNVNKIWHQKKEPGLSQRAMFFYLFKYLELNQSQLRKQGNENRRKLIAVRRKPRK